MISLKLQVFILKEFENNWTVGDFFLQTSSITFICSTDVIARESMVKEEAGVNPQDQASNNIQPETWVAALHCPMRFLYTPSDLLRSKSKINLINWSLASSIWCWGWRYKPHRYKRVSFKWNIFLTVCNSLHKNYLIILILSMFVSNIFP